MRFIDQILIPIFWKIVSQVLGLLVVVPAIAGVNFQQSVALQSVVFAFNSLPDTEERLRPFLDHPKDRQYLRSILSDTEAKPRFQFVSPGTMMISIGQEQLPIEFLDFETGHVSIFKRDFYFHRGESAELAIRRMQKVLQRSDSMRLLLPSAEAIAPLVVAGGIWVLRGLAWAYVTAQTSFMADCAMSGMNSVKTCIADGPMIVDESIASLAVGAMVYSKQKLKGYFGEKTFELEDVTCPSKDQPLRAKVLDAKKASTSIEIFTKGAFPDRVEIKGETDGHYVLPLNASWAPAFERAGPEQLSYDREAALMIAQAAHTLARFCASGDSAQALERFRKLRDRSMTLKVNPDLEKSAATVK